MITNPQDYVFYSNFQYPPKIQAGDTDVAVGDPSLKVLATGITLEHDWSVYEQYTQNGETVIRKNVTAYINQNGELVARGTFPPSKLVWRVYGY